MTVVGFILLLHDDRRNCIFTNALIALIYVNLFIILFLKTHRNNESLSFDMGSAKPTLPVNVFRANCSLARLAQYIYEAPGCVIKISENT